VDDVGQVDVGQVDDQLCTFIATDNILEKYTDVLFNSIQFIFVHLIQKGVVTHRI